MPGFEPDYPQGGYLARREDKEAALNLSTHSIKTIYKMTMIFGWVNKTLNSFSSQLIFNLHY